MQSPWRIELLGWLRAELDGHTVTRFSTHNTAALLARLALWPRRAHSREELVELLWPEVDFDAARARLRQALTSLRHQLEPPGVEVGSVLIADRTHVRLNPEAISTDVADFEAAVRQGQLAQAIALYKGELLPGFYEDWILAERNRLQARFEEVTLAQSSERALVPESDRSTTSVAPTQPPLRVRLPIQFTRFFGCVEEQARLAALLAEHRLVTLTGPGGAGKTRLAIEVARQQAGSCQVLSVGLADLVEGARLAEAIVEQLRLARDDTRTALDRLVEALSAQPTLLLLDNLEHLVAHAAPLVQVLLSRVPSLRLLVTSRRRIQIAGEREFPVPPLPLPSEGSTPAQLAALAAVQLFVDRAQAVRPDFQITPRNAAELAVLCQKLEGSPLALELAAARVATLTLGQVLARLTQRFELLATRRTDKDARHRSLWAAIAWSVDLLPESLQQFWRALSVFRGGFTVEAATAVTGEHAALEALTQLRERSLITVEDQGVQMRFRLAESLREFAQEQLDPTELQESVERHGAYFLAMAQQSEEALRGAEEAVWLEQLAQEHDNFRAALAGALMRGDVEFSQLLAGSLWGLWERRGYFTEAKEWLEQALTLAPSVVSASRAKALNRLGAVLNVLGEFDRAVEVHQETRALYETLGDLKGIALAWNRLGYVEGQRGRIIEARAAFEEALKQERVLGNRFNMAAALVNLGILAQKQQAFAEAEAFYTEGLALFQEMENPSGIADTLLNLSSVAMEQADWEGALPLLAQAAVHYEALGDRWSRSYITYSLGVVARHQARWEEAKCLLEETLAICQEVGDQSKVADTFLQLGILARWQGHNKVAIGYLEDALALHENLGQSNYVATCLQELEAIRLGSAAY